MGARIVALAEEDSRFDIVLTADRDDDTAALVAQSSDPAQRAQVIIDFSSNDGAIRAIELARAHHAALLVGTTALTDQTRAALKALASTHAVLVCANTSLGVAVMRHLAKEAARLLGPTWNVDIIETHHTKKLDAPSGTALAIADSVAAGGVPVPPDHIHALRAGDVIGEHTLQFASMGEVIQITHRATTRDLFVLGALRAAAWLAKQGPGWYSVADSLGVE